MTSWYRYIVTFYPEFMVSELTWFNCQSDMTSSSVLGQVALHPYFQDGFWLANGVPYSLFIWDALFPILRGYTANGIWRHRDFAGKGRFTRYFIKIDRDFLIAFPNKNFTAMNGFREKEVFLLTWFAFMSVISQIALNVHFHDGFWKNYYDFLMAFHSNFSSVM